MPPHKAKSTSLSFVEGQQNGAGDSRPFAFCCLVGCAVYLACLSVVAARACCQQKCILFIAATSRCRHEPEAPSPSRHRCRVRVVRANKKTMPDKNPGTGFFIAAHHPGVKVRLGRCAFCLIAPAHPSCQAARGRAALLLSRSSCHASHPPQGLPENENGISNVEKAAVVCSAYSVKSDLIWDYEDLKVCG